MRVKVNVTKDVLERSKMCGIKKKYKSDSCAIALAFIDLFETARVGHFETWLITYPEKKEFDSLSKVCLPKSAINFIRKFDMLSPSERVLMTPFSFEIEVPEYVISKIGISQIYKTLSESRTLELVMNKEEF